VLNRKIYLLCKEKVFLHLHLLRIVEAVRADRVAGIMVALLYYAVDDLRRAGQARTAYVAIAERKIYFLSTTTS
jgi:hypothetical protein